MGSEIKNNSEMSVKGQTLTKAIKLVDLLIFWQKQLPCFNLWTRSVLDLEDTSIKSQQHLLLSNNSMLENYLKSLDLRIKKVQKMLNQPQNLEPPDVYPAPTSSLLSSDKYDCLLDEKIKFYEKVNRRKMQKILSRLDRKIILVDDQRK